MTVQDLAQLVADMRRAQKGYYRTRSDSTFKEAIRLEKRVDETLKFLLSPQRELFAGPEEDKAS